MQTSSQKISPEIEQELYQRLNMLLADLQHPDVVHSFLTDFMTRTEQLVFAKRLAIFWMLHKGHSYEEIKQKLKVSSATISSVAEIQKKPGMQLALEKLIEDDKYSQITEKLFSVLPFLSSKK